MTLATTLYEVDSYTKWTRAKIRLCGAGENRLEWTRWRKWVREGQMAKIGGSGSAGENRPEWSGRK